jgi:hypothetical protein
VEGELSGWTITGELDGSAFPVEVVLAGLRITASAPGTSPTVWQVPA